MTTTPDPFDRLHDTLVASARRLQAAESTSAATRRRWWRTHPLAVVAVALTVTGTATAAVVATTSTRDVPMSQQKPISTATLHALTSPDAVELTTRQRQLVQNSLVSDYELLPQNARAVPSPSTRPGHSGRWIIIPGRRGLCVDAGSGSFCTPTSGFKTGKAFATSSPSPQIVNPRQVERGVAPKLSAGRLEPGPGSVKGVAPNDVTTVVARNKAGTEIARASVVNNVYELRLPQFREMTRLDVQAGDRVVATQLFR